MRSTIAWTVLVLAAVLIAIAQMEFNLSAQQEPGPVETAIGNRAKHFFIRRASRHGIPPRAADLTSKRVRSYSDRELFWIIQNGIRYTGMPSVESTHSATFH